MSEESEKRFQSIMDKLFHAPKPRNPISSSGTQLSRGRKRGLPMITASMAESNSVGDVVGGVRRSAVPIGSTQPPLCRPWDRGDLMKRLATFKSMTWFGKPKVVSAVNCARRGWINVEMDIIACEACGARLLFSTPSSWTQQQIEKAAAVFSLKLDNGHKQLCPWIDNSCDETLAQFPPTPAPALVDGYRERFSALMRLSGLPMISSSAIDYMRGPQLEHLLEQSSMLEYGFGSFDTSRTDYLDNECEAVSANLYLQAQKLISLCGWEPRFLPYVVDCKDQSSHSASDAHLESSPQIANGQNPGIVIYSQSSADEVTEVDEDPLNLGEHQSDPDSVVLDCKLCGASVGLWAFCTVPRPLELFRFIGSSALNGPNDSANCVGIEAPITNDSGEENRVENRGGIKDGSCNSATSLKERSVSLNLTIAGGPPPTKQNFRAKVSLPIISRHLRVGFSSDVRDRVLSNMACMNQVNIESDLQKKIMLLQENDHADTLTERIVHPEDTGASKHKRNEDGLCISTSDDQSSCLNQGSIEQEDTLRKDYDDDISLDGRYSGLGLPAVHVIDICCDSRTGNPVESMENRPQNSNQNETLPEDAENARTLNADIQVGIISQARESLIATPDANGTVGNREISNSNLLMTIAGEVCNHQHDEDAPGTDAIHSKVPSQSSAHESSYDKGPDYQCSLGPLGNKKKVGMMEGVQSSVNNEVVAAHGFGKDLKRMCLDQAMKFDPIRQHRHFCPWIVSTGSAAPGWQLILNALDRGKESSHPILTGSPSSSSMFEVDDPVVSVRKLFMSPTAKRMKHAHGSS